MRRGAKDKRTEMPRTRWRIVGKKVRMIQEVVAAMVRMLERAERGRLREIWEGGFEQQRRGASTSTREERMGRRRRRGRWRARVLNRGRSGRKKMSSGGMRRRAETTTSGMGEDMDETRSSQYNG